MKIQRKTRKRGGMNPPSRRASSSSNASSHDNIRQPVILSSASSSKIPPTYNNTYSKLLAMIGTPVSNMGKDANRKSVSNAETQNNNGYNIPSMTEDELLQQYTSVYEKITSKEDTAENAALLKQHLKTIQNPIAIHIFAHMDIINDGYGIYKNATLHAYIITRNDVHFLISTFKGFPRSVLYPTTLLSMPLERATVLGFPNVKNINTLTSYHVTHQFKKPLDKRLIHMFQTISKIPHIGQTTTGWMPDNFRYPNIPIGNPLTNGLFMEICRAL